MDMRRKLSFLLVLVLAAGCGGDGPRTPTDPDTDPDPDPDPPTPVITAISPTRGLPGTPVTITGSGFGTTPAENTVRFNGREAAVTAAGADELVAEVPADAGTGTVSVTVSGRTGSGPEFVFLPDGTRFVHGGGTDSGNECFDPVFPCATIARALSVANPGDVIDVAAGTYTSSGSLIVDKSITILGAGKDPLSGTVVQGATTDRVMLIEDGTVVTLRDLTIRNGRMVGAGSSGPGVGGGILALGSTLELTRVTIEGNVADEGGGMAVVSSAGTLTDVTFRGNTAVFDVYEHGNGGGLMSVSSSLTLRDVQFVSNLADRRGGGLRNAGDGELVLENVTFEANEGFFGGGAYLSGENVVLLADVDFARNRTTEEGGGLYNDGAEDVALVRVRFEENEARGGTGGGGMYTQVSSPRLTDVVFVGNRGDRGGGMTEISGGAVLRNVVFSENMAEVDGGGLNLYNSATSVVNATFDRNAAGADGGGVYVVTSGSIPILTNVTLAGNEADDGGGVAVPLGAVMLRNSIVWGNIASTAGNQIFANGSGTVTLAYGIYGDAPGDLAVAPDAFMAENSLTEDPLLVNAGGGDLRLGENSPAIHAGDPATEEELFPADGSGTPVDLDGNPRFVGASIDAGAFERP